MGKDKKKQPTVQQPVQQQQAGSTTQNLPGGQAPQSGDDPKGRSQNAAQSQQTRYENQQGPMVNAMARNYGQGATQGMGDYTNVMSQYNKFLGNKTGMQTQGPTTATVGNFDMGSYNPKDPESVSAFIKYMQGQPGVNPSVIRDPDYWTNKMLADTNAGGLGPDASYVMQKMMTPEGPPAGSMGFSGMNPLSQQNFESASRGYQNFADTGGYSSADMANLRARGTAPIRSAYENAQREMSRKVNTQGGYSPNFMAAQTKMARDQGQSMSDAMQGIEGGIVNSRNQNQLAGLAGLSGVGSSAGNLGLGYDSLSQQGQLSALQGMTSLYGATPGMASTFGNQLLNGVNQGGDYGINQQQVSNQGQQLPGQYDQAMKRSTDVLDLIGRGGLAATNYFEGRKKKPIGGGGYQTNTTQSTADIMGGGD